jgi:Recombinase
MLKKPVRKRLPFWIRLVGGRFVLDPYGEALVLVIFILAANGWGVQRIVKKMEGKGRRFSKPTVHRLLKNRQVLGERHAKRPLHGDPVEGYYPAAVTPDLFNRAQQGLGVRKGQSGMVSANVTNLFRGLAKDSRDGTSMTCKSKDKYKNGTRPLPYVSYGATKGYKGSKHISFHYDVFETALLRHCEEITSEMLIVNQADMVELARLEAIMDIVERKLQFNAGKLDTNDTADYDSDYAEKTRLERLKKDIVAVIDVVRAWLSNSPAQQQETLPAMLDRLKAVKDDDERELVRTQIKWLFATLVEVIWIHVQVNGRERMMLVKVVYQNGLVRTFMIYNDASGASTMTSVSRSDEPWSYPGRKDEYSDEEKTVTLSDGPWDAKKCDKADWISIEGWRALFEDGPSVGIVTPSA